jgi:copper transport protein
MLHRSLIAMLLWLPMTAAAFAHASLTATEPADGSVVATAPGIIRLIFNEPVSPTSLKLTRPDRDSLVLEDIVTNGNTLEIKPPPDLSTGTHLLSWRVVSEDGHPIGGSLIFSIGQAGGAPPDTAADAGWPVWAGLWIGKVALYLGIFIGVGGVFAIFWFVGGDMQARRLSAIALGTGAAGALVSLGFQGLDAVGESMSFLLAPATWGAGLKTSLGPTIIFVCVGFAFAGLALLSGKGREAKWMALSAVLTTAFSLSLSGHASAAPPQWIMRPAVFLHVAAITIWAGALVPLMLQFKAGRAEAVGSLHRFSVFIPLAVITLVLAGGVLAFVQVGTPTALFTTAYGTVFLIKLGLLLLLFVLAAANRWWLTQRSRRGEPTAISLLVRLIAAETVVMLLIFGVAAAWRFTPPPRSIISQVQRDLVVHLENAEAAAEVAVKQGASGAVALAIKITKADGQSLDPVEVTAVLANPQAGVELIRRNAQKTEEGWSVPDLVLPLQGKWKLRLDVLITDFDITRLEGEIEIRP